MGWRGEFGHIDFVFKNGRMFKFISIICVALQENMYVKNIE